MSSVLLNPDALGLKTNIMLCPLFLRCNIDLEWACVRRLAQPTTIFLCGDVMTGRGIDQILPRPCDPALHEPYVQSAIDYVALAESKHGAIARGVAPEALWGDALDELARARPVARIVNCELVPTQMRRFRVRRASTGDASWIANVLGREGRPLGTAARLRADGRIELEWNR